MPRKTLNIRPQDQFDPASTAAARLTSNIREGGIPADAADFIFNYCYTMDPKDQENGIKLFPRLQYLEELIKLWQDSSLLVIAKSRQLMVSWIMVALHLHMAMTNPGRMIFFVSKKEDDAGYGNDLSLLSRAKFIYDRLPERMKIPCSTGLQPPVMRFPTIASTIQGLSQESEAARQYSASAMLCVAPQTRILTGDLRWVQAGTLKIGDVVAGFDEQPGVDGKRTDGVNRVRKWRRSQVTNITKLMRPSYRLTFSDGTQIVCSSDHQWLCGYGQTFKWLSTERLRARGDSQHTGKGWAGSKVVKLCDTWGEVTDYTSGYIAAAFDGEGHLKQNLYVRDGFAESSEVSLCFSQNENRMLDSVKIALAAKRFDFTENIVTGKAYSTPHHHIVVSRRPQVMRLLGEMRPQRLLAKLDLGKWGMMVPAGGVELITKEPLGMQEVLAIATTTRTYVAEGLASHNCDEWAFQEQSRKRLASILPTLRGIKGAGKSGKLTGVSTPNGKGNVFYEIVHDVSARPDGSQTNERSIHEGMADVMQGLKHRKNRNGFTAVALHYSADPEKTKEWADEERAHYTSAEDWDREMELSFSTSAGKRVFPAFTSRLNVVSELSYNSLLPIWRGWDWGYRHPACVWMQVDERGRLNILWEYMGTDMLIEDFTRKVIEISKERFGKASFKDAGDPAGLQKSDKHERTTIDIVRQFGIRIQTKPSDIMDGIHIMRSLIPAVNPNDEHPFVRMRVDSRCKTLVDGFLGGYVMEERGEVVKETPKKDGFFEHEFDATRYACSIIFNKVTGEPNKRRYAIRSSLLGIANRITGY